LTGATACQAVGVAVLAAYRVTGLVTADQLSQTCTLHIPIVHEVFLLSC
jgi:hypothetical protein